MRQRWCSLRHALPRSRRGARGRVAEGPRDLRYESGGSVGPADQPTAADARAINTSAAPDATDPDATPSRVIVARCRAGPLLMDVSSAPAVTPSRPQPPLSAKVALAAVAWWGLYVVNDRVWDTVVYDWAGLAEGSRWGEAAHFFFYDITKIALLLTGVIFVVTVLRSFMSRRADAGAARRSPRGRRQRRSPPGSGWSTPFCSCSAVPAFIGFVAAGVPLGVTLSFLIASPMVNEVAIVLLFGLFGWKITALYIAAGCASPSSPGIVLGRLHLERWVEPFVFETRLRGKVIDSPQRAVVGRPHRRWAARRSSPSSARSGPTCWSASASARRSTGGSPRTGSPTMRRRASLGVPIAVGLGVPLYSNAAGVLPLVEALHDKGLPMGTVLAFMMSVVALSMPEMILLRRVLKPQLIATYVGVVATGILATGYLFNLVL